MASLNIFCERSAPVRNVSFLVASRRPCTENRYFAVSRCLASDRLTITFPRNALGSNERFTTATSAAAAAIAASAAFVQRSRVLGPTFQL